MDTIGERLRYARKTAHERIGAKYEVTQTALGEVMGLRQPTITKIESNKNKRSEVDVIRLMDAAKFLRASFFWLATGNGDIDQDDSRLLEDIETSKGFPVYWPQDISTPTREPQFHMNVAPLLYDRLSKQAFYTLVTDEGMNPIINMGDLLLVDPGGSLRVGGYVLAKIEGQKNPVLRRIIESSDDDGYVLTPLNGDFKPRTLEKLSDIIGVAVESRAFLLPEISYKNELKGGKPLNIIEFKKG
ncbi:helix-turn-helix domain-containing protein [Endozoicomonas ascidiicola]|uniref:helix-turn-helix domain-containing protein n=1 Tax=Endozoicomonas ascidiicola TaxID=1698521 RepID=UPI00082F6C3B|nr:XRE family transcriptional regulator [Endozoicomonas ascidiicola]